MSTYQEIQPSDLQAILSSPALVLVDVRNNDEVAHGMIEGAIHIPLAMLPLQYGR